jgi:hypothetical protein
LSSTIQCIFSRREGILNVSVRTLPFQLSAVFKKPSCCRQRIGKNILITFDLIYVYATKNLNATEKISSNIFCAVSLLLLRRQQPTYTGPDGD